MSRSELLAISPLDGRYAGRVEALAPIVSEYGLIRNRVRVEAAWLQTLGSGILPDIEPLTPDQTGSLEELVDNFSERDAERIKEIESTTNHDVKAVELWLRERLEAEGGYESYLQLIHFGCTSEDINNLAYAMMLKEARDDVLLPAIDEIGKDLEKKAHDYAEIPLLAKTHGQPASPTTLGKEMSVFVDRLSKTASGLSGIALYGKFNGATGNYSADMTAYPEVDWPTISRKFVEALGMDFQERTTQIEPHDSQAELFDSLRHINTELIGLCRDMWLYIAFKNFKQTVKAGEVGSSTMPHKVNPIDYENAEANFEIASALLAHLSGKLPISRLQRDLTDSSAQRVIGTAFGHALVALTSLKKGLGKVAPDETQMAEELDREWAVLTEPLQTIMRRHGVKDAYETIKDLSRGKKFDEHTYIDIVSALDLGEEVKEQLLRLTPATYIGQAVKLAKTSRYDRG